MQVLLICLRKTWHLWVMAGLFTAAAINNFSNNPLLSLLFAIAIYATVRTALARRISTSVLQSPSATAPHPEDK